MPVDAELLQKTCNIKHIPTSLFPAHAGMYRTLPSRERPRWPVPRTRGDVPPLGEVLELHGHCSPHTRGCTVVRVRPRDRLALFPAHAGMYRCAGTGSAPGGAVPRTRGDVPYAAMIESGDDSCSPHTRGCTAGRDRLATRSNLFPAHAGMYRRIGTPRSGRPAVPRTRGDVPEVPFGYIPMMACSPHTRGCTGCRTGRLAVLVLFPAHAGMYRSWALATRRTTTVPRTRGDVPQCQRFDSGSAACSPHTRGCTDQGHDLQDGPALFPAHAGMYRSSTPRISPARTVPRTRGDVPEFQSGDFLHLGCSPHTRGCTVGPTQYHARQGLFPAHAGMYRPHTPSSPRYGPVPRTRGDVPLPLILAHTMAACSPHTRGCTGGRPRRDRRLCLFPAHAGMYRDRG